MEDLAHRSGGKTALSPERHQQTALPPKEGVSGGTMGSPTSKADLLVPVGREEVDRVDEADAIAARAQDERLRPGAVGHVAHAAQEVAAGDAGRDHGLVAADEVIDAEDATDVIDPVVGCAVDLGAAHRPQLALDLAAQAAQRSRG